ncbi:MAG: ribonuclease HIII [Ignavibacteriales bacterium]|nr:MAG: ribonuclease HIII [Ignavibacteriales bacterium]
MEEKAERQIISYLEKLKALNYTVDDYKKGQYNFYSFLYDGDRKAKLTVYYGKNGIKTFLQGDTSQSFTNSINSIIGLENPVAPSTEFNEPDEYIGTDESGKGDYFGPLVVAGVYLDKENQKKLREIGVRDSKEISDSQIKILAARINRIIKDNYNIILITPNTYNKLHLQMKNVNRILGWAHAKVIENILEKTQVPEAISDKFGDEKLILSSLQTKGKSIKLSQFTRAERYVAVAAASVLARKKFIDWFSSSKEKYNFELPKGASSEVIKKGKEFVTRMGKEKLNEIAKIHFKTTKQILN